MRSFRDQRLTNDYEELLRLERQLNRGLRKKLEVQPVGSRPYQAYNLFFYCAGYVDESGATRRRHHVFLEFPKVYPMEAPPTLKRVSALFHPNIYPHGVFCLGFEGERKWRPGISLESLVLHVSRLVRFDPDWVNLNPPASRTPSFWQGFMKKVRLPADDEPFVLGEEPDLPAERRSAPTGTAEPPAARRSVRIGSTPPPVKPEVGERQPGGPRRPIGPIRITRNPGSSQ